MRKVFASKLTVWLASVLAAIIIAVSCTKQSEDILKSEVTTGICDTANMQFSADVLPILVANCYRCHANGIINGGVSLDGYNNVVHQVQNGNLIAAITHAAGYVPMPYDGGKLSDCNIAKIQAWINAGAPDN
ncbi:MAG TPA: hypothetical protein VG738_02465 [Chitinophagaceae bacterium]|nr:hypothetical protein [Chitinophagaceae bacterium]